MQIYITKTTYILSLDLLDSVQIFLIIEFINSVEF